MFRLVGDTSIKFMSLRRVGYVVSVVLLAASIGAMVMRRSNTGNILNYGIDFAGGTVVQVKFDGPPPLDALRDRLGAAGLTDAIIQRFGNVADNEVLVRVSEQMEEARDIASIVRGAIYTEAEAQQLSSSGGTLFDLNNAGRSEIASSLAAAEGDASQESVASFEQLADAIVNRRTDVGGMLSSLDQLAGLPGYSAHVQGLAQKSFLLGNFTVLRVESVGPAVGKDLKQKALSAILWAIAGILLYIWFRFELRYGMAAVVCLLHDVVITVGAFAITGRDVDLPVVAALLTIVGYSLNDTIVVFDRIRDNLRLMRKEPFEKIIDTSINQTLSRTLLTSGTTLLVVISLYVLGGGVINGFAFALLIGVLAGTYSSVFVASACLLEITNASKPKSA